MGCCYSKPDDDGDEVKVVQDDSTKGIGGYGSITNDTRISDDTQSKKTLEKSKDDGVLKEETKPVSPVKEHARLVKSGATTEASPLLATPPGGFRRSKPKEDPKDPKTDSPRSTPSDSPKTSSRRSTPRKDPKSLSTGSPRSTPSDSSITSPETSPKKSSVKRVVKKKSRASSSSDRSSSKEHSHRDKTLDKSQTLLGSQSPTTPTSPSKPTLLDLAKEVTHPNSGDSGKEDYSAWHTGSKDDVNKTTDSSTSSSSSRSPSSDDEKTTSHYSSFDQTPICMSGDEMSSRVVKTESPPKPKRHETLPSGAILDKKKSKTKDAMKKTKKTMKDAGKKAGKKINKMFKFSGKDSGKKTKKTDSGNLKDTHGKSKSTDKGELKKPSAAKSNTLPPRLSPAKTEQDATNTASRDDTYTPSHDRSKSRMSQRMHSKYAREKMEAYEAKKDAAQKTSSGGFTDPRQAAHERGEKLEELGEVTESMRDGAGEFAKMAKQLRMKTEGKS